MDIQRDDIDVNAVQQQAKQLLDSFFEALRDVPQDGEVTILRNESMRTGAPQCDVSFKDKLLHNAPKKDADHILVEKKTW